ncbi:MAG: hypothetical protein QY331_03270 [Melioribacteraceae bacterium]|nr:hypothetical protein [Melioribacteraceae bacterium]WKZ70277.1 MAG: hypothetical protein QY331_03270 [Melioribacteraceae bacterium]
MKKIMSFMIIISFVTFAQNTQIDSSLSGSLEGFFTAVQKADYKNSAEYIVYSGNDESRKYLEKLNSDNAGELQSAERIGKKVKAYLDISDSYEFIGSKVVTENERTFVFVNTAFKSGKQSLNIEFKFVDVQGKYLLVGIE